MSISSTGLTGSAGTSSSTHDADAGQSQSQSQQNFVVVDIQLARQLLTAASELALAAVSLSRNMINIDPNPVSTIYTQTRFATQELENLKRKRDQYESDTLSSARSSQSRTPFQIARITSPMWPGLAVRYNDVPLNLGATHELPLQPEMIASRYASTPFADFRKHFPGLVYTRVMPCGQYHPYSVCDSIPLLRTMKLTKAVAKGLTMCNRCLATFTYLWRRACLRTQVRSLGEVQWVMMMERPPPTPWPVTPEGVTFLRMLRDPDSDSSVLD